jgi:hypothetical protein
MHRLKSAFDPQNIFAPGRIEAPVVAACICSDALRRGGHNSVPKPVLELPISL